MKTPSCRYSSKKCGYCKDKLPKSHSKPFCYKCINKLAGKEASALMKKFLSSMQTEMLATVKAFRDAAGQSTAQGPETEEFTPREGTSSQESISGGGPSALRLPSQSLPLAQVDEEEEDRGDMESQVRTQLRGRAGSRPMKSDSGGCQVTETPLYPRGSGWTLIGNICF